MRLQNTILTKVFPSPSNDETVIRKEVPILCATGSIPPVS